MGSTETAVSISSERKVKAASAPLQILLFRLANDADVAPLEDAIVRAFQGSKDAEGYLANGADLGVAPQLFDAAPPISVKDKLDASCHTVVLVLVSQAFQAFLEKGRSDSTDPNTKEVIENSRRLLAWLSECWDHVRGSKKRHQMLAIPLEEGLARRFLAFKQLQSLQVRPIQELGEFALRPTMLALLALHESRRVLALPLQGEPKKPDDPPYGYLRLFISHAKIDGLPLAHSLRYLIKSIKWLEAFYDVDDLPEGSDWALELERGVASSLIIVLRTEVYDSRYWCQQEVIWSDRYCTPAVLVDARTALNHEASTLPFARLPIARVPDGNLMRILSMALREGLRFLLFARSVEEMKQTGMLPPSVELRVFSYAPSMRALLFACRSLAAKAEQEAKQFILYPDPPLGEGEYEAALALVAEHAPKAKLLTPQTLATSV